MKKLIYWKNESGSALVITALAMVALLGFTALVFDVGRLYFAKSNLQKALDASVLAGAQGLRTSEANAESIAEDVSKKNGFSLTGNEELSVIGDSIEAKKQISVSMTFAKVLGLSDVTVHAKAKATVAPLKKASGIAPLAIEESEVPSATVLNCGKSNPGVHHGNCGYLDFGNGAEGLMDAFINGVTLEEGTKIVETEPGIKNGKVKEAIDTLIQNDKSKPKCQDPSTADNSCDRVITIPVIDTWDGANGKSNLNIVGFASYWVESYEDKKLTGHFIRSVSRGEIGKDSGIGEFNVYGVKLVE